MNLDQITFLPGRQYQLTDYFKLIYQSLETDWKVESALPFLGEGKSNEGTNESKAVKRYYITPTDERFREIFLNFNDFRVIESIVWFIDPNNSTLITLGELKTLFGDFKIQNIIYDQTTEIIFTPSLNENVEYVSTNAWGWVIRRPNGSMFYKNENKEIEVDDEYKFSSLIIKIKNSA